MPCNRHERLRHKQAMKAECIQLQLEPLDGSLWLQKKRLASQVRQCMVPDCAFKIADEKKSGNIKTNIQHCASYTHPSKFNANTPKRSHSELRYQNHVHSPIGHSHQLGRMGVRQHPQRVQIHTSRARLCPRPRKVSDQTGMPGAAIVPLGIGYWGLRRCCEEWTDRFARLR